MNFTNAQIACQELETTSYVAVANDAEENAFIDSIADSDQIWLGCNAMGGNNDLWTCPDGSGKTFDERTGIANLTNSYWSKCGSSIH